MLNELLLVERGAQQAGVGMTQRHPDVKDARRIATLLVSLNSNGHVESIRPVPAEVTPWSLRDGNHNSFPFVQPKGSIWFVPESDKHRGQALDRKSRTRRESLLALATQPEFNLEAFRDWPGDGLLKRVRERRQQIATLDGTAAASVPATIDRFVLACDPSKGGEPQRLLREIADKLVAALNESPGREWVDIAVALLVEGGGGLMFNASGDWPTVLEPLVVDQVSAALRAQSTTDSAVHGGCCALTGAMGLLVESKFPQPNLPVLGQTYLFARNRDTPANDRYARFSADSMPVLQEVAIRLAAVAQALTSKERRDVTWRPIPGEVPKQTDLLLAFVEAVPDAPAAAILTEHDVEDDLAQDAPTDATLGAGDLVAFEKRTERLIETVRARIGGELNNRVQLAIIRKIDPANRKVVYAGQPTVKSLYLAAKSWIAGERNVPAWLRLPVLQKGERKFRLMSPPHVAPLGMISFSRQLYIRGGTQRQDVLGLSAAESLGLFFDTASESRTRRRSRRVLRLVLARRTALAVGTTHAMRRGFNVGKEFDHHEALRTVTVLGVLLHKLKMDEDYMNDTAFKLGQLLAAADVVHAGYCADVRGGDLPPSLLGNQVFAMAQTSPGKALATLCRRWKPYAGWAEKASRAISSKSQLRRDEEMRKSKERDKAQRGWDISKALSVARRIKPLVDELRPVLGGSINDEFRAELLLGYMAGLPSVAKEDTADNDSNTQVN